MDKIKTVKIKNEDGTISTNSYNISVDAKNVDMDNGYDLQETIGTIKVGIDGNIEEQLKKVKKNTQDITNLNNTIKKKAYYFNSIDSMKHSDLKLGEYATTLGYYTAEDGGDGDYIIVSGNFTDDGGSYHRLDNGLFAKLILRNKEINVKQFGAYGDGVHDDTNYIQSALRYCKVLETTYTSSDGTSKHYYSSTYTMLFKKGRYIINNITTTCRNTLFEGDGSVFYPLDTNSKGFIFQSAYGTISDIKNMSFYRFTNYPLYINLDNIDCSSMTFTNCTFISCIKAFYLNNQSCNIVMQKCYWYHCKEIMDKVLCDMITFNECWFSEYRHSEEHETSFVLRQGTTVYNQCMFIPSGNYDTSYDVPTSCSWFHMYGLAKLQVNQCRMSSEPGYHTIVDYEGSADIIQPLQSYISFTNNQNLCFTTLVNFIKPITHLEVTNNSFGINNCKVMTLDSNFLTSDFETLCTSSWADCGIRYIIKNNTSKGRNCYDYPQILQPVIESDFNNGMAFDENGNLTYRIGYGSYTKGLLYKHFIVTMKIRVLGQKHSYCKIVKRIDFSNDRYNDPGLTMTVTDIFHSYPGIPDGSIPNIDINFDNGTKTIIIIDGNTPFNIVISTGLTTLTTNNNVNVVSIEEVYD